MDLHESVHEKILRAILLFPWREWRKPWKTSLTIAMLRAEDQTRDLIKQNYRHLKL